MFILCHPPTFSIYTFVTYQLFLFVRLSPTNFLYSKMFLRKIKMYYEFQVNPQYKCDLKSTAFPLAIAILQQQKNSYSR